MVFVGIIFSWMAMGFLVRYPGLGNLGFWGDEGYTAVAVKAILETGYPELPSGGLYFRSVPFLYLEALSAVWGGVSEFSLRVPSVFFNLAAVMMSVLLAQRLLGTQVGVVVGILMMFSSWEVEFSRYARMYVLFQFLYLSSLYVFYRGYIEDDKRFQWVTIPLWLLTICVHKLGLTLVPLLLIPILHTQVSNVRKVILGVYGLGIFGFWQLLAAVEKKLRIGSVMVNIPESAHPITLPISLPRFGLLEHLLAQEQVLVFGVFLLMMVGGGYLSAKYWSHAVSPKDMIIVGSIGMSCALQQFGLACVLLFMFATFWSRDFQCLREWPFVVSYMFLGVGLCFWGLYGFTTGHGLSKSMAILFGFPDVYNRFLKYFLEGWLVELILAGLGGILIWREYLLDKENQAAIFCLWSLVGALLLMSFAHQGDNAARYSFHLFPLLLLLQAFGIVWILQKTFGKEKINSALTICVLLLMLYPTDTQIVHSLEIRGLQYSDDIHKPLRTPGTGYGYRYHPDYKNVSAYIKERMHPEDMVISMEEVVPYYYIGRLDYLWIPQDREKISQHQFAGTGVVKRLPFATLQNILHENQNRTMWMVFDELRVRKVTKNAKVLAFLEQLNECTVFTGNDKRTKAQKFTMKNGEIVCLSEAVSYLEKKTVRGAPMPTSNKGSVANSLMG